MPKVVNHLIVMTDGYLHTPFINDWWLDWETPTSAIVSTNAFQIDILGEMFDEVYGEQAPAVSIPDMPDFDKSLPSKFQNYISTFSMDAFFGSLLEVETIAGWYNSTSVTTTVLNALLPGIEKKYGSNVPVDIHININ